MFYYLNGKITVLEAGLAVVDCGGVGYACHCSTYTQSQLRVGEERRLYTHVNVKEDAFDIFGFSGREELRLFEQLTGVTGVGPASALATAALAELGYSQSEAASALKGADAERMSVEELVRYGLRAMVMK